MKKRLLLCLLLFFISVPLLWARMPLWILNGANAVSTAITLTPSPTSWSPTCTEGDANATQTFTMTANNGSVTGSSPAAALTTGTDFFIDTDNCDNATVSQDSNCTIDIHMPCDTAGTPTDTLTVTSNASDSPKAISLSGTISAPGPTYAVHLEFENDTDFSDGYTLGGNDYLAGGQTTLTVATAMDSSAAQAHGGSYSALNPISNSGNIAIPITNKDHFNSANYRGAYWYYASSLGTNYVAETRLNSNNYFYAEILADGTILLTHRYDDGTGTGSILVTNDDNPDTVTLDSWNLIEWRASVSLDKFESRMNSGTWYNDGDADVMGIFNVAGTPTEPTVFNIGENNGSIATDNYLDDITLWVTYAD